MVLLYFGSNGVLNATYTGQIVLVTSLTMLQLVKFEFKAFCVFKKKKIGNYFNISLVRVLHGVD